MADSFPHVSVHAVAMDFLSGLHSLKPLLPPAAKRLIFYAGSSIGNFDPPDAAWLLGRFTRLLEEGDALLIGYDLQKDRNVLRRAYDDSEGVTASFNLNLLARFNRELGADFDLDRFRHVAVYNEAHSRIEMHLESLAAQRVRIGNESVSFDPFERMHTESSYKYTVEGFDAMAAAAGFQPAGRLDRPRVATSPSVSMREMPPSGLSPCRKSAGSSRRKRSGGACGQPRRQHSTHTAKNGARNR